MDWNTVITSNATIASIVGAIIGGAMTGFFTIKATSNSQKHQREQTQRNEEILIKGLLQSIHDEIETVFERYQETMGAKLESLNDNEAIIYFYPLVSDFFSVYNGNTFLIGRISDNDLRKQIIKTYTYGKAIIDSFRMNNDLLSKFEFAHKLSEETQNEVHKQQALAHYKSLVEYAKTLKETHKTLESEVNTLLRQLRKNGVLNESETNK